MLDGLPLFAVKRDGHIRLTLDDLSPAPQELTNFLKPQLAELESVQPDNSMLYGRLIGMRGKERRSLAELIKRIHTQSGPVRSVRFRALALVRENLHGEGSVEIMECELDALCGQARRLQLQRELLAPDTSAQPCEIIYHTPQNELVFCRRPRECVFTAEVAPGERPLVKSAVSGEVSVGAMLATERSGVALLSAQSVSETDKVTAPGCKVIVRPTGLLTLEETLFPRPEDTTVVKAPAFRFTDTSAQLIHCDCARPEAPEEQFIIEDSAGVRRFARTIFLTRRGGKTPVTLVTTQRREQDDI